MRLVQRARKESVLPHVSYLVLLDMEPAGVIVMRSSEAFRERVSMLGHNDQMDVVCHQTVAENSKVGPSCVLSKQVEVHLSVRIAEKHLLPFIATLRDVMCPAGQYDSCASSHLNRKWWSGARISRIAVLRSLSPK